MGQAQSNASAIDESSEKKNTPTSSLQSLIQEATTYGSGENETIDPEKALECPCIADLKKGSCGSQFSEAFLCFLKSTTEEKGSDCVHPFVALQSCIKANPNAFSKDVTGDDEVVKNEEVASPGYKLIPPTWALEPQAPKPRL